MINHHPIDLEIHRQARKIIAPVCNFSQSEPSNFLFGAKNTQIHSFVHIYEAGSEVGPAQKRQEGGFWRV